MARSSVVVGRKILVHNKTAFRRDKKKLQKQPQEFLTGVLIILKLKQKIL